jgi:hypothetical protein
VEKVETSTVDEYDPAVRALLNADDDEETPLDPAIRARSVVEQQLRSVAAMIRVDSASAVTNSSKVNEGRPHDMPIGGEGDGNASQCHSDLNVPDGLQKFFRADCDYWDEAEDGQDTHFPPSPTLPANVGLARGRSPPAAAPLGQRVSGIGPDATAHRLLGASMSSSSSGPKLAPSINWEEEGDSRMEASGSVQVPAGAVQGEKFCWVRGELIGRGSLGFVHRALEARTGKLMAVKEVLLDTQDQTDDKFRRSLQNEIDLYKDLNHPCIVAYLGHDYTMEGRLYIFLEYMPGGSIAQVLSQFGPLDESLISRYTCNLLEGLLYLHTRDPPVLHRDIKGANILVGMNGTVKLSDFGCSKRSSATAVHTLRGSIPWMAPEVMCQKSYGRKADIWSLGCVLIEMSTAEAPWGNFDNCLAAMARIAMSEDTPPVPAHLSEVAGDFVKLCTRREAQERPDAAELLKHGFVEGSNRSSIDESWG